MAEKKYKPRLGFDIRVGTAKAKAKQTRARNVAPGERSCEWEDCEDSAACSLPKSPREPRERVWYCLVHAREHNKSWNYFDGMTEQESAAARRAAAYGDRPTWSMGKNDRARAAANATGNAGDMADAFGVLGEKAKPQAEVKGHYREGKRLTKLQAAAFDTMALPYFAPSGDIRRRYAELVRRFHPDSNGGDRSAEEQLNEVVKAHTIMKKAKFL